MPQPLQTEADFNRLMNRFLKQHPEYIELYRVSPDGDVQVHTVLLRAFTWWCREQGSITQDGAMRLETFHREVEYGRHSWILAREEGGRG